MATLKDLSRELGLSVTQVSRALNGHSDVSARTRERVLAAAEALHYRPNVAARRLVTGHSGILGLVLAGVPDALSERMYMRIVCGLSAHFGRAGLQFIFRISDPAEDQIDVYRQLINSGALDGFVIMETQVDDPRIPFLQDMDVPFVVHGRTEPNPNYPFFDIDNFEVARLLTAHLAKIGHRRIALVNGQSGRTYAEERKAGYKAALTEAGLTFDPVLHRMEVQTDEHGRRSVEALFRDPGRSPTAIVCSSTLIAKGVYEALAARGLSVPGDVSVVAHDDLLPDLESDVFEPALSCTYAPLQDAWRPLAEMLIKALAKTPLRQMQEIGDVRFIERASVGPPRHRPGGIPR